jgi:hypothetical protein
MNRAIVALLMGLAAVLAFSNAWASPPVADAAQRARLVESFSDFAGSAQNAQSLVEGLRNGTTITLMDSSNAPRSFNPVTKAMAWSDVKIALAIGQAELASAGIAEPTPIDIEAVLNGGTAGSGVTMTNFTGVLTQRWSGLGWNQIVSAHNLSPELLATTGRPANADTARAAPLSNSPFRQVGITAGTTARTAAAAVQ